MILNEKSQERMYEITQHPMCISELSRFSPASPPNGGRLVAAINPSEALRLYTRWKNGEKTLCKTYSGYEYPIRNVIFDPRKTTEHRNTLAFYKNIDFWPFEGCQTVDFSAVLIDDVQSQNSLGADHRKNLTPGQPYHIEAVLSEQNGVWFILCDDQGTPCVLPCSMFR